jgi:starch synthase
VDTVVPYQPLFGNAAEATGVSFMPMTHQALTRSVAAALEIYPDKPLLQRLRLNGMKQCYSWDRSSREYVALYGRLLGGN